jgi:hypothetical protein
MAVPQKGKKRNPGSIRFRFRKAGGQTSVFPEPTGLEELDAFTSLEDAALGADGSGGLEAAVLGHEIKVRFGFLKNGLGEYASKDAAQPFFVFGKRAVMREPPGRSVHPAQEIGRRAG